MLEKTGSPLQCSSLHSDLVTVHAQAAGHVYASLESASYLLLLGLEVKWSVGFRKIETFEFNWSEYKWAWDAGFKRFGESVWGIWIGRLLFRRLLKLASLPLGAWVLLSVVISLALLLPLACLGLLGSLQLPGLLLLDASLKSIVGVG